MGGPYVACSEEQWARLESAIMRLGIEYRRLRKENEALARALAERERELERLQAEGQRRATMTTDTAHFVAMREQIQQRIDDLLSKIELAELATLLGRKD